MLASWRRGSSLSLKRCIAARFMSNTVNHGKFYELRTYSIAPSKFVSFIQLTQEHFHIRKSHSRLIGYWTTELGGLNEVVHIWEYGKLIDWSIVWMLAGFELRC